MHSSTKFMRLVLAVMVLVPTLGRADGLTPAPFEATYDLEARGVIVGEAHWTVIEAGSGFVYQSISEATGMAALLGKNRIVERSEWRGSTDGARPASYRYSRSGLKKREIAIDFDWERGEARTTAKGQTWSMKVPPDTLDKLSYVLAIIQDVAGGERTLSYNVADGGTLKIYTLRVAGDGRVETALGSFDAVAVVREREQSERETTIWLAPALGFLPVKVEHREPDGEELTLHLRSLTRNQP